jgi:hypothetical protein
MATRLAETYEEDSLTAVISFLGGKLVEAGSKGASSFPADCSKLVDAGRFDELITLLSSHVDLICAASPKGACLAGGRQRRLCARAAAAVAVCSGRPLGAEADTSVSCC